MRGRLLIHPAIILTVGLLLSGCQSNPAFDAGSSGLAGELGNPIHRPSPADVYIELGTAYLNTGQVNEAFINARKAVLADDRSSPAHNLLGVVYQRLGELDLAREHYKQAVDRDERNPYALNALGQFLCAQQDYAQAQVYFVRALANPFYPTPWVAAHNAGTCYEWDRDLAKAETAYRQALQANPQFAPALLRMAQLSYDSGRYLSARAYIQRYTQSAPHTAQSLWLGVQTETQLGDRALVAMYQQQLRHKFPDSEQVKYVE